MDKINISRILRDNAQTFHKPNSKRVPWEDIVLFVAIPLIVASVLAFVFDFRLDSNFVSILIGVLSIFVGLLINVIVMVFGIVNKEGISVHKLNKVKEVISNISFNILLSLFAIVTSILTQIHVSEAPPKNLVLKFFNFITNTGDIHPSPKSFKVWIIIFSNFLTYAFLVEFFLINLMVLKRMYALLTEELDDARKRIQHDRIRKEKEQVYKP